MSSPEALKGKAQEPRGKQKENLSYLNNSNWKIKAFSSFLEYPTHRCVSIGASVKVVNQGCVLSVHYLCTIRVLSVFACICGQFGKAGFEKVRLKNTYPDSSGQGCCLWSWFSANGHTTLKAPVLVRSPKLSNVGLGEYLDGRPPGNTRCCWLLSDGPMFCALTARCFVHSGYSVASNC